MLKILQAYPLRAFVAILKIDAIYALYPESFCDKNLAVRKVFAFSYSVEDEGTMVAGVFDFKTKTKTKTRTKKSYFRSARASCTQSHKKRKLSG